MQNSNKNQYKKLFDCAKNIYKTNNKFNKNL